ncbi:MAG: magnesium/cobalt transporter CorA [Bacteroidales bacterium]
MEIPKVFKIRYLLNRKKKDPGKFVFTGYNPVDEIDIQLFKYNKEQCIEDKAVAPTDIVKLENNGYNNWLNIYGLNEPDTIASICKTQEIHNLVIQDILDVNQRPKFQEFDNFSFLTLKSIVPSEDKLLTEQISFVFGDNYLISFQERKADHFEHLRYRLREDKGILRERGADVLLYSMLESILDNYFITLNKLDEEMEEFNFSDFKKEPSPDSLEKIENHKKFVQFVKKAILPIKEFSLLVERGECRNIENQHIKYFLEIKDLCLTLLDNCDMILSSLESSINLFFSVQGHRMNQVMKTLTIVATIFIPLTFIAGVYGMNFINIPELEWKYGYFGIWGIMILVFIAMILYFRRKKWF